MTKLKPLRDQTIVITGASSGIGLVTARIAARRGAAVVLVARNESDLRAAVEHIRSCGGRAIAVSADVADSQDVARVAHEALRTFGGFDTWVNNAAVAVYGRLDEASIEDMRRQMDVTFWGQVYGSLVAVRHLRHSGGALINVGSGASDRAIPLLGMYSAAKHALKAFTDTLRMELERDHVPVAVTLIKPSCINTPFYDKARTLLGVEPQPIPPVYAPEAVAEAVLHAAERPVREISVGAAAAFLSVSRSMPRLTDIVMEHWVYDAQHSDQPASADRPHNLYSTLPNDGGERGANWNGVTLESSAYTRFMLHPVKAAAVLSALAMLGAAVATAATRPELGFVTQQARGETCSSPSSRKPFSLP
jgi:short-subunit dehydrogenase